MKALKIVDLKKSYNGRVAIDSISFSVERGEFFGFLGPNGAGKTSTINCITGIATHDSGTIEVFGVDVKKQYREARKLVGLAPQEFNIDFFAPVRKTLDYMGGYFGMRKRDRQERVDRLIHLMELEEHADKQFRHLSGGLKRRVMIARSLVHDPEFLILDEPTAGVDVHLRIELWKYLEELNRSGKTIMLTSHYIEEVEKLCSRITIINRGSIVAEGDKSEFIKGGKSLEAQYLAITEGEGW